MKALSCCFGGAPDSATQQAEPAGAGSAAPAPKAAAAPAVALTATTMATKKVGEEAGEMLLIGIWRVSLLIFCFGPILLLLILPCHRSTSSITVSTHSFQHCTAADRRWLGWQDTHPCHPLRRCPAGMYGHIAAMARAVKKGIDSVEGVEGVLYQVRGRSLQLEQAPTPRRVIRPRAGPAQHSGSPDTVAPAGLARSSCLLCACMCWCCAGRRDPAC